MSRYIGDSIIGGSRYGSATAITRIRNSYKQGVLVTKTMTLQSGQRLDTVAGSILGDSSLWWTIAALSGIGWGLQVPPGTRLIVPTDLAQLEAFL